jgi:hypothetical protein
MAVAGTFSCGEVAGEAGAEAQEAVNSTATSPTVQKKKRDFIFSPY